MKKLEHRSKSAGNVLTKKNETSETLRDGIVVNSEHVKHISRHVPKHLKPLSNEQLGHYLAGLIDGDGHFSKAQQLVIVFSSPDAFLAYYLKNRIGYGAVRKVKSKQAVILIISKPEGLEIIFNLINGKLRTHSKLDVVNNYISNIPYFKLLQSNIDFKLNNSNCLNNHWLAGFSDVRANFQIKKLDLNVGIRLIFIVKNKELVTTIKNFLGGNIAYNKLKDEYLYDSSSFGSAKKVINYFDKYHLLSKKNIDYLRWRKSYLKVMENNYLLYE